MARWSFIAVIGSLADNVARDHVARLLPDIVLHSFRDRLKWDFLGERRLHYIYA